MLMQLARLRHLSDFFSQSRDDTCMRGQHDHTVHSASERYVRHQPLIGKRLDALHGVRDAGVRCARPRYLSEVLAGTALSMAMMQFALFRNQSVWMLPNLITTMWLGPNVVTGALGPPTLVGLLTHEAMSALMGSVTVLFLARLTFARTLLAPLGLACMAGVRAGVLSASSRS